jgi:hypothetical protein
MGPDGQVVMPQTRRLTVLDPPALCTLGPCTHYHEAKVVIDSAEARDGSDTPDHTQTVKTCYPHAGIEFDLNGAPVTECNLWAPLNSAAQAAIAVGRREALQSSAGVQFQKELNDWRARNAQLEEEAIAAAVAERAEEDAAQAAIDENNASTQDPE